MASSPLPALTASKHWIGLTLAPAMDANSLSMHGGVMVPPSWFGSL